MTEKLGPDYHGTVKNVAGTVVTDAGVAEFKKSRQSVNVNLIDRAAAKGAAAKKSGSR